jgi:hypothetical protein
METEEEGQELCDVLFHAMMNINVSDFDMCERTRTMFPMTNQPNKMGRVTVTAADCDFNGEKLKLVMEALQKRQPSARVYAQAMHNIDAACEYKLSVCPTMFRTDDSGVPSPWASYEGQVLHDLVAHLHRLNRSSRGARSEQISALKELCPQKGEHTTRQRKTFRWTTNVDGTKGEAPDTEAKEAGGSDAGDAHGAAFGGPQRNLDGDTNLGEATGGHNAEAGEAHGVADMLVERPDCFAMGNQEEVNEVRTHLSNMNPTLTEDSLFLQPK